MSCSITLTIQRNQPFSFTPPYQRSAAHLFSLSIDIIINTDFSTPRYQRPLRRTPRISFTLPFHVISSRIFCPTTEQLFISPCSILLSPIHRQNYEILMWSALLTPVHVISIDSFLLVPPIYLISRLVYLVLCVSKPPNQPFLNCKILPALSLRRQTNYYYQTATAPLQSPFPPSPWHWRISNTHISHTDPFVYLITFMRFLALMSAQPPLSFFHSPLHRPTFFQPGSNGKEKANTFRSRLLRT